MSAQTASPKPSEHDGFNRGSVFNNHPEEKAYEQQQRTQIGGHNCGDHRREQRDWPGKGQALRGRRRPLVITGRKEKELKAAAAFIERNVTTVAGDVSRLEDLDRLHAGAKERHGHIDILFANAGAGTIAPLAVATEAHFDQTFDVNVRDCSRFPDLMEMEIAHPGIREYVDTHALARASEKAASPIP